MKCLDSNFLIDFLRNESKAVKMASKFENESICSTSINIFEVLFGIQLMKEKEERIEKFKQFIKTFDILLFDLESIERASEIAAELVKQRKDASANDCLIAGTMIAHGCNSIVSNDFEHFDKIKGIKVERY